MHEAVYPTISVIIPAYNAASSISRTLQSVLAQTYPNIIEIVVVDDGSQDETAAIVREQFPQVILLQQVNSGPGAARNTGVARSTGAYLAFLDSDDEWLPDKVAAQIEAFKQHPECDLQLACAQWVDMDGTPLPVRDRNLPDFILMPPEQWLRSQFWLDTWVFPHTSGWLLKRALYDDVGGQDPTFPIAQDWQFLCRALLKGYRLGALTKPLFLYYRRADSLSHGLQNQNLRAETRRWWSVFEALERGALVDRQTFEDIAFDELVHRARRVSRFGYPGVAAHLLRMAMGRQIPLGRRLRLIAPLLTYGLAGAIPGVKPRQWYHLREAIARQRAYLLRTHS